MYKDNERCDSTWSRGKGFLYQSKKSAVCKVVGDCCAREEDVCKSGATSKDCLLWNERHIASTCFIQIQMSQ